MGPSGPEQSHGRSGGSLTEPQLRHLMDSRPWEQWSAPVDPLSFPTTGWFSNLMKVHSAHVAASRQGLWEDRHRFSLPPDLRASNVYAGQVFNARKKRRTKVSRSWLRVLEKVVEGMKAGHCDLDILLDPFFQLVTPTRQLTTWYPSVVSRNPLAGLFKALQVVIPGAFLSRAHPKTPRIRNFSSSWQVLSERKRLRFVCIYFPTYSS